MSRRRGQILYSQGDLADSVFYTERGYLKVTVASPQGKQAVVGILTPGDFFGYACLSGDPLRSSTVTAIADCTVAKISQREMSRALIEQAEFSHLFLSYLLARSLQLEAELAHQLCNPCEVRLARTLLCLAAIDSGAGSPPLLSNIDQHTLAEMVGTTQPRISILLNQFKKEGLVEYGAGLRVNKGLTDVVSRGRDALKCSNA